jgi:hypothetical protein
MNSKWPDILCSAGVLLIGGALWAIHPAVTIGYAGVVLTWLGVRLNPPAKKESKR